VAKSLTKRVNRLKERPILLLKKSSYHSKYTLSRIFLPSIPSSFPIFFSANLINLTLWKLKLTWNPLHSQNLSLSPYPLHSPETLKPFTLHSQHLQTLHSSLQTLPFTLQFAQNSHHKHSHTHSPFTLFMKPSLSRPLTRSLQTLSLSHPLTQSLQTLSLPHPLTQSPHNLTLLQKRFNPSIHSSCEIIVIVYSERHCRRLEGRLLATILIVRHCNSH